MATDILAKFSEHAEKRIEFPPHKKRNVFQFEKFVTERCVERKNTVVYCENQEKYVNTLCKGRAEFLRVTAGGIYIYIYIYRMVHEKPARRLVDQRGRRSRTLYRKLNKCKCKVITG